MCDKISPGCYYCKLPKQLAMPAQDVYSASSLDTVVYRLAWALAEHRQKAYPDCIVLGISSNWLGSGNDGFGDEVRSGVAMNYQEGNFEKKWIITNVWWMLSSVPGQLEVKFSSKQLTCEYSSQGFKEAIDLRSDWTHIPSMWTHCHMSMESMPGLLRDLPRLRARSRAQLLVASNKAVQM